MKDKMMPKWVFSLVFLLFSGLSLFLKTAGEPQKTLDNRGISDDMRYALIIGIDKYENEDWKDLKNAIRDGEKVVNELKSLGFDVTYIKEPTLIKLENSLKEFFYNERIDNKSQLFLWYSGHGHTVDKEGFLVPADAPSRHDARFVRKAFPVERFREYSRYTAAEYVYIVFDSCFSSPIFNESSSKSPGTANLKNNKVRQFLCSGSADQERQDNGSFLDVFLKAIKNKEETDINIDDHITDSEIGQFIKKNVKPQKGKDAQIPYYGNLEGFEKGDFVFILPGKQLAGFFQDYLKDGSKGPEMSRVQSDFFTMGDVQGDGYKNEKPVHTVNVESFAVGRFEVTFEEYDRFCDAMEKEQKLREKDGDYSVVVPKKPDDNGWGRGNRPVINVSWEDAREYTKWLYKQTGYTYRLPTEAEWEYMARADTETSYWWGNEHGLNNASCDECGEQWGWDVVRKTAPVGSFTPNQFGIYDTVGNVWEWTCSQYTDTYIGKEIECLDEITTPGQLVVIRGGAWDEKPKNCRVSRRKFGYPYNRSDAVGFRVVRELK